MRQIIMAIEERTLELQKQAEALLENDEVLAKMLYAENPEALMQIFAENNIIYLGIILLSNLLGFCLRGVRCKTQPS